MKKLFFLLTFAFCLFLSNATFAANEVVVVETPVIENAEANTAEEDDIIICASGGIDVYIDGDYIGTYDCVIIEE